MNKTALIITLLIAVWMSPGTAAAQLVDTKLLTLEAARDMMAAAESEARRNGWNVAIAIVDAGGHLLLFQRIDETQIGSTDIAIKKARTAVLFKRPTKVFEDGVATGRTALIAIDDVMPLEGGLPLVVDGRVIGGIGVSGVTPEQDGIIARAGIDALAP